ncbi:MAG: ribokinase [Candidatus Limnocylindrales bacterium]
MRVVVFGSLNLDTTFVVDRQPAWGETVLAQAVTVAAGGKGANQAVAAARVGAGRVLMVGRVGADASGAFLRSELARDVTDRVGTDLTRPTGGAFILRRPTGENAIVVAAGANDGVELDDLASLEEPEAPTVLVLQLEIPVDVVREALVLAASRHWHVVLNAAPARNGADGIIPMANTLVVNEVEASQLVGLPVRNAAEALSAGRALLARGPSRVAITLGAQGAVLVTGTGAWRAAAPAVQVVDTTAAGDASVGALAAGIAEGLPEDRLLALAVAAGSLATTRAGAQPSLPARAEAVEVARSVVVEVEPAPERVAEGLPM